MLLMGFGPEDCTQSSLAVSPGACIDFINSYLVQFVSAGSLFITQCSVSAEGPAVAGS